MSRWSKRSQEEKEQILKNTQYQKREQEKKQNPFSSENIMDIYNEGEIPIFCHRCHRFKTSEKYEIIKTDVPLLGKDINVIIGKCRKCGFRLEKPFPRTPEEMIIFGLTVQNLRQVGRLEDRRNKNE